MSGFLAREGASGGCACASATVHETKWCPQRNRCLEATGVRGLSAQSPSKLGWRLRVEVRMICCFGSTLDNPRPWASWTVAATSRLARPLRQVPDPTPTMPGSALSGAFSLPEIPFLRSTLPSVSARHPRTPCRVLGQPTPWRGPGDGTWTWQTGLPDSLRPDRRRGRYLLRLLSG